MARRGGTWLAAPALAAVLLTGAPVAGAQDGGAAPQGEDARYALAGGCYALRSQSAGRYVVRDGDGYRAGADAIGGAEPFRMRATALGRYLLYGRERDFMTGGTGDVTAAGRASGAADWRVDSAAGSFRIHLPSEDRALAVSLGGRLVTAREGELFAFEPPKAVPSSPRSRSTPPGPRWPAAPRTARCAA